MKNSEFLENHPIELSLLEEETQAMRELLNEANQNFVLEVRNEVGVNTKNGQYTDFYIYCPTTNFANAYFHVGIMYAKKVLPIWNGRFKKNNQTEI